MKWLIWAAALVPTMAWSLTRDGNRPMPDGSVLVHGTPAWLSQARQDGLVSLYLFKETTGPVLDVAGYANPTTGAPENINLTIDDPGTNQEVRRLGNGIAIDFPTLIHSGTIPTMKISRECRASQQLTIEAWVRPRDNAEPFREVPLSILTMSRATANRADALSSTNRNFLLGQHYDGGSMYKAILRTANSNRGADDGAFMQSEVGSLMKDTVQHVIFTRYRDVSANGREVSRLYLSYVSDSGAILDTMRDEDFDTNNLKGSFANWDTAARIGIANEISYASPLAQPVTAGSPHTSEDRAWLGEIYMIGIYCKALEPVDILGQRAPGLAAYSRFPLDPNMVVTPAHNKAVQLYKRLAGVSTSLANPVISQMAQQIQLGTTAGMMAAADLATRERDFYNITVRDFAARMSTRDELVSTPLNDFIATMIGVVRDEISAKQLLTGNFVYEGDPAKAAVPSAKIPDLLTSNRHYEALEMGRFDLGKVLRQVPQTLYDGRIQRDHPEPSGLLTTRAWMAAHAIAGTNRRLVEYSFREFMCVPLEKWADNLGPDDYVGRDVDRFPAGDHAKYQTTCRACHSVMDGFRGAFAFYNFNNEYTKYTYYVNPVDAPADEDEDTVEVTRGTRVVDKMNHNDQGKGGRETRTNEFFNNATRGANAAYFGWGSKVSGYGIKDFGQMISESKAFPRCMAQRVFRSVCKREVAAIDQALIDAATTDFVASDYNLRKLFQRIAIDKDCIGAQ